MDNPLLDKFDKEIDEMTVSIADNFQPFEDKIAGKKTEQVLVLETAAELLLPAIKKEIKSLAHSHLEEAYKLGQEDAARKIGYAASTAGLAPKELTSEEDWKQAHQSNLERLIEKCGNKLGNIYRANVLDHPEWKWGTSYGTYGSTPTEAVENLIKALEKK